MVEKKSQPSLYTFAKGYFQTVLRSCPIKELKLAYEVKTGAKRSGEAWRKAVKRLEREGIATIERHEQLYMVRVRGKANFYNGKGHKPTQTPIHSSHNYRFSIEYKGEQPRDGLVRAWGRSRKQFQVEYRSKEDLTLQVFKRRIIVMLHNPKGISAQEQVIEARKQAFNTILSFAKERALELPGFLESTINPHFVLEEGDARKERTPTNLNGYIRDAIQGCEAEIEEIVGSMFDDSHKGRFEHFNTTANYKATPKEKAESMEWLLAGFRKDFAMFAIRQMETDRNVQNLSENHRSHVEAIKELRDYVKELREIEQKRARKEGLI